MGYSVEDSPYVLAHEKTEGNLAFDSGLKEPVLGTAKLKCHGIEPEVFVRQNSTGQKERLQQCFFRHQLAKRFARTLLGRS